MTPPADPPARDQASLDFDRFRREGDPAALTALFDGVAPELLKLAGHFARDMAEAEDLVQETFLIAIRKARRWESGRPVVPWLVGILTREARRMLRRRGRAIDVERLMGREDRDGEREALDAEVRIEIEAAVNQLPARYGEVVRSALLEGGGTLRDRRAPRPRPGHGPRAAAPRSRSPAAPVARRPESRRGRSARAARARCGSDRRPGMRPTKRPSARCAGIDVSHWPPPRNRSYGSKSPFHHRPRRRPPDRCLPLGRRRAGTPVRRGIRRGGAAPGETAWEGR